MFIYDSLSSTITEGNGGRRKGLKTSPRLVIFTATIVLCLLSTLLFAAEISYSFVELNLALMGDREESLGQRRVQFNKIGGLLVGM